jgi:hypothetical protein
MLAAKKKQIEIHNKLLFPTINKENSNAQGTGAAAQPRVKIADLSHNLLGYENGNPIVNSGNDSVGSLRIVDQSTGGVAIRKKNNQAAGLNAPRKDNSPGAAAVGTTNNHMSPQQQYLLSQMYTG